MRFSAATLLSLPLLAAAQQPEPIYDHFVKQLDKALKFIPKPFQSYKFDALPGSAPVATLTLDNWNQTLQSSLKPGSTTPEEWFVLISGGNKTCFGRCDRVEQAFKEAAVEFKDDPTAPHLAYVNCDAQPVLCNSWSAGPPGLWVIELTHEPPTNVHMVGVNVTAVTSKNFTEVHAEKQWKEKRLHDGYFHPFNGQMVEYGVAVPLGYFFWFMNLFPQWVTMILVSWFSRSMMNRGVRGPPAPGGPAPAGGRVPGAPAGDGTKY